MPNCKWVLNTAALSVVDDINNNNKNVFLKLITVSTLSWSLPFTTDLDESLIRIGRALAGRNFETITKLVFHHPRMKEQLINKVLDLIESECALLCSRSQQGPFQCAQVTELDTFNWDHYIHEMEQKSPILFAFSS